MQDEIHSIMLKITISFAGKVISIHIVTQVFNKKLSLILHDNFNFI
jgi:hypothetical protein